MNRISFTTKLIVFLLIPNFLTYGQTASSTAGCAELTVSFTAPQATSYYWVFGDGLASVSNLQNPVHSYIQPGSYTAQLFDEENGTQIGDDIFITVYSPIVFEIFADATTGCAPLEVNFTSILDIHPDIEVEDIVWTFGDGNSASGQNTNYTYNENGVYSISLKVITSGNIKCDEPAIFQDYIVLEGDITNFSIDRYSACDVPAEFVFTNTIDAEEGTTFFWDFGNQQTVTGEGPHTITYETEGLFYPELVTTNANGCVSSKQKTITIGAPVITPTFPDTVCLNSPVLLSHSTIAQSYQWDFTGTSIDTSQFGYTTNIKRPIVEFIESGLQTFTLTAFAIDNCETTVTLDVYVYEVDASFTLGPEISCTDPLFIEYTAADPNYSYYIFNNNIWGDGDDVTRTTPLGSNIYEHPDRDEYHINEPQPLLTRLVVVSTQGCRDTVLNEYTIQKPEAFFVPDIVKGCIPFDVKFSDLSFSDYEIQTRDWDYGDGQTESFSTTDTLISHTYTTIGIHEAVLTISDASGCEDVSREVQIIAIDKDTIEVPAIPLECPELTLCVGDTLTVGVTTDQINSNLHIESDDGRFNHCWKEVVAEHAFQYPGVYPINATYEFYTIYLDSLVTGCELTIEGTHSSINYLMDCETPYVVDFSGENSINADDYAWYLEDQLISNEQAFTYTFNDRGVYTIYLDTRQNGIDCVHRDSVLIHITDIQAVINIPENSCVSQPTPLDASLSQNVHSLCHAGYIWQFENQRPREVNDSILYHSLLPGFQTISLIVEDINGCTDTVSSSTTAYDLNAAFTTDTLICLPSDVVLTNLSSSDTTIISWDWDFGGSSSDQENPVYNFDNSDYDPTLGEGESIITVSLVIEDAIGCIDSTTFFIETYDIYSAIYMSNGPVICQNESIVFDAADYTEGGSFLTYVWDFGANGTSTEDNPAITFTELGEHPVTLLFTEDLTGCQGTLNTTITVTPTPIASFISDQDDTEFICFPEQISFTNTSIVSDTAATYSWDFGNGATSTIENPVIPFDKGTYQVTLIVETTEGCMDTFSRSYTLVGPEGNFTVDQDLICPGEEISFTLLSSTDVSSYTWDFGDGVQINDQSPVSHVYNNQSSVTTFTPTLILRSDENGCELIQNIPINVSSITADFQATTGVCPGEISFSSNFENPQTIEWNIDGQIITGTSNPSVAVTSTEPTIDVILNVTDAFGCEIERIQTLDNPDLESTTIKFPNVFSPNGDNLNAVFNIFYDETAFTGELEIVEFKVYNRWGELLYNNENPTVGWDGNYKGSIVPPDIYAYYIEVAIDGCTPRSKKGNVTVIK